MGLSAKLFELIKKNISIIICIIIAKEFWIVKNIPKLENNNPKTVLKLPRILPIYLIEYKQVKPLISIIAKSEGIIVV